MPTDKKQRPAPGSMYFPPMTPVLQPSTMSSPTRTPSGSSAHGASPSGSSINTSGSPFNSFASAATMTKALTPNKQLGELLRSIEPRYCFQPAVEELLLEMASEFVENVVDFSSKLSKHRRSTVLEAKDLQFSLAKNYGISLAGVLNTSRMAGAMDPATVSGSAELNPLGQDLLVRARPIKNSLHMHRLALKRKTLQRTKAKLLKGARTSKVSDLAARKLVRKSSTSATK